MSEIKIATFNIEWMVSLFGGRWTDWVSPTIPPTFPGRSLGGIRLEPIADVPALCQRIAGVIQGIGAQIIGIQEGPPLKEQLEVFVKRFLGNEYVVHHSNPNWQSVCALVHKSISNRVTVLAPDSPEVTHLRSAIPYYPWGKFAKADQKKHRFARHPLILRFRPDAEKELRLIVLHTKSKFSKLKTREQWEAREPEAIQDALDTRQKLSAEIARIREFLDDQLKNSGWKSPIITMGDFNDGPFAELMEEEFLIHNIIDELVGSLLTPTHHLRHAMEPQVLATASTTRFPDPLNNGQITEELIDHILVSPGIWRKTSPFRLKKNSCRVEAQVFDQHNADTGPVLQRGLRPSDHKPVSAVLTY